MKFPDTVPTVTAAIIAAAASLLALLVTQLAQLRADRRLAYRAGLNPRIAALSNSVYEVVAFSTRLGRASSEDKFKEWRQRAEDAAKRLGALRRDLRFVLWGVDHGLFVLSRTPLHMAHARGKAKQVDKTVAAATLLRCRLDRAARAAFLYGRPPGLWDRFLVRRAASAMTKLFEDAKPDPTDPEGRLVEL